MNLRTLIIPYGIYIYEVNIALVYVNIFYQNEELQCCMHIMAVGWSMIDLYDRTITLLFSFNQAKGRSYHQLQLIVLNTCCKSYKMTFVSFICFYLIQI